MKTYVDGSLNTINTTLGTKQNNLTFSNPFLNTSNTITLKYNTAQFNIDSNGNLNLISSTSSQWTTSGTKIYYNTGNVGIGTSTAYTKLELYGSAQNYANSGCIVFSDSVGNVNSRRWLVGNVAAGDYGDLTFAVSSTITGDPTNAKMTINKSGSVGIGTSSPSTLLQIAKKIH